MVAGLVSEWISAQIKGDKLMLVSSTAKCVRAALIAIRFLDGSKGVTFHTFSLPENSSVHLLIKKLGGPMHEGVVREELENLGICVQGLLRLHSSCRNQEADKPRPLTPHFIVSVPRGPEVVKCVL